MSQDSQKLYTKYFIDLGNYRKTVLLAGGGRSGTTWVGDLINYRNRYRVMFEPFHAKKIGLLEHFEQFQYLRPDNRSNVYLQPVTAILSGNIRHEWIDRFNKKFIARKRLIKEIRGNLMLKWIQTNFPEIPIVLLLRHPCAVINSRMKLGWQPNPARYLNQIDLVEDFLKPFCPIIENTSDIFEKYVIHWCVQYLVPLKQFKMGEILVAFYEDLCVEPERELKRIFDFIGEPFKPAVMDEIWKPSAVSRQGSAIASGGDLIRSWQKDMTPHQVEKVVEILNIFGLGRIYSQDPMPLTNPDSVLDVV